MPRTASLALAAVLLALGLAAPAHAQLARTFVSSLGNDANDCSRLAPCRNFQRAHDNTLRKGEITVLDPGGYGAVSISKGISIINDGMGEAGVLVSGGANGITIAAGAADAITLRGLTIKGIGFGGGNGIVFTDGGALTVENCTIRDLDGNGVGFGIVFQPKALAGLTVTNTAISDNSRTGILVAPTGTASVRGVLDRVGLYRNGDIGLWAYGQDAVGGATNITVIDGVASNNGAGFVATSDIGKGLARLVLLRSAAVSNDTGIQAQGANAQVIVNASAVAANGRGWEADAPGQIFTYGNNVVAANADFEGNQPLFTPK